MIQTRLSSPAQIIVFGEEGPDRHLSHLGEGDTYSLKSFFSGYPGVGGMPRLVADRKALGFSEGRSGVQRGWEARGGKTAGFGGRRRGFEPGLSHRFAE